MVSDLFSPCIMYNDGILRFRCVGPQAIDLAATGSLSMHVYKIVNQLGVGVPLIVYVISQLQECLAGNDV